MYEMRWICQTFSYLAQTEHLFESVSLIAMSQDPTILAVLEQNPPPVTYIVYTNWLYGRI